MKPNAFRRCARSRRHASDDGCFGDRLRLRTAASRLRTCASASETAAVACHSARKSHADTTEAAGASLLISRSGNTSLATLARSLGSHLDFVVGGATQDMALRALLCGL